MPTTDRPRRTPQKTGKLLAAAGFAGRNVGTLCQTMYLRENEACVRRILGVLSLVRKHGPEAVDDACAAVLELGVADYRPVPKTVAAHRASLLVRLNAQNAPHAVYLAVKQGLIR